MSDYVQVNIDGWTFKCYGSYEPRFEGIRDSQGLLVEDYDEGSFDCDWFEMEKNEMYFSSLDLPDGFISAEFLKLVDDVCYYTLEDQRKCQDD